MCGVVAYAGKKPAEPFLLKALQRLEYRGYDGFGYLLSDGDHWLIRRELIPASQANLTDAPDSCTLGIGHTRWATHGKPSIKNTHPICGGRDDINIAVVHNGTIENYSTIVKTLISHGYTFQTETDTEVLAHFIDYLCSVTHRVENLVDEDIAYIVDCAFKTLEGNFSLAFVSKYVKNRIVIANRGMSMVVSPHGYAASDPSALEDFTDKYYQLEPCEIAIGGAFIDFDDGFKIFNMQENRYTIPYWKTLKPNTSVVLNAGHSCAMENEIFQQENLLLHLKNNVPPFSAPIEKIFLFGCGSSYNAALLGKYYIEQIAGIPTEVEYASELVYRPMLQPKNTLFIAISQSGETADTLRAMELLFDKQKVIGITNNKDSRAYDNFPCLLLEAGQEIGVAATKTFTLTCTTLLQLALRLAEVQGMHIIGPDLQLLHYYMGEILNSNNKLAELMAISIEISKYKHALYLARSQNYPIALEGALKLKEVSYIHAEAMPAAEMKHGPIALIDDDTISIFIITNQRDNLQAKVINNMQEIKARGGKIIAISDTLTTSSVWKIADSYFCIPKCHEYLQPIVANIALQLIAYYTATILGRNVDRPRSLAKSVTVE